MKTKVWVFLLIFAAILFIDYLLLMLFGYVACKCGAEGAKCCSTFCNLALIFIVATTILPFGIAVCKS